MQLSSLKSPLALSFVLLPFLRGGSFWEVVNTKLKATETGQAVFVGLMPAEHLVKPWRSKQHWLQREAFCPVQLK